MGIKKPFSHHRSKTLPTRGSDLDPLVRLEVNWSGGGDTDVILAARRRNRGRNSTR